MNLIWRFLGSVSCVFVADSAKTAIATFMDMNEWFLALITELYRVSHNYIRKYFSDVVLKKLAQTLLLPPTTECILEDLALAF